MQEEFREIENYPPYSVSNFGRVRNNHTGRLLKVARVSSNGWYVVSLRARRKTTTLSLSRLVAEAFLLDPEDPNTSVVHRDGDRANCVADNLVWKPRWFAVCFMKEMQYEHYHEPVEIYSQYQGLIFRSISEMASALLILPSVLYMDVFSSEERRYPGYGLIGSKRKLTNTQTIHGL